MKALALVCVLGVTSLVLLRMFEITTNVASLDRWVGTLSSSLGLPS